MKRSILVIVLLVCSQLWGCGLFTSLGARSNSFDSDEERIVLRLIKATDFEAQAGFSAPANDPSLLGMGIKYGSTALGLTGDDLNHFSRRVENVFTGGGQAAITAILVAPLIGYAIDFIKAELDDEAKRYERQFDAVIYDDGFWIAEEDYKWGAFELTRTTKSTRGTDTRPAFRFVCAIVPSVHDPNVFLLKPLFFQVTSAKAKVASSKSTISVKVNVVIDAMWWDPKSELLKTGKIALTTWKIGGYDIAKQKPKFFSEKGTQPHTAGWFGAVPLTHPDATSGGAFKLTVIVTERDESKAANYIERASKMLGENKDRIVNQLTGSDG